MDATKTTTTNGKPPAKQLSPAELAEELIILADDAVPWKLKEELEEAERAVAAAKARVDRAGEKKLRVLRAKSIEEARAILAENPADVNLKKLCQRLGGWKPLQERGATDQQIRELLGKRGGGWPDYRPYPRAVPQAEAGYGTPRVWVDPDKGADGGAHLEGQKLVDAVRRVMNVPKPAAPTKPPAAKKAAPAKKGGTKAPAAAPAAKAPPADAGGDDDDAGGAGEASAKKPMDAKARKRLRREFEIAAERAGDDKLRAELKKLTAIGTLSSPDGLDALRCEVIRAELDKRKPAAEPEAAAPLPSVEALEHPQAPIEPPPTAAQIELEPGHYYDADRLGLTPEALEANRAATAIRPPGNPNDGHPAPSPARIGKPLKIGGRFWAAVSASVEHHRVTYQLVPVIPEGETTALYDDFDDLRRDHDEHAAAKAPEEYDLDGLGVVDPQNLRWVVGANEVYLRVPRDPAAAAKKAHDREALNAGVAEIVNGDPAPDDDPNVDGRGVFVAGVREVWVTGTAKGDAAKVVIRVACGLDGMYRTGHLLEVRGAQAWNADSDEPVKLAGQTFESEAYAIRARAKILMNAIGAAPGAMGGGAWTAEQRRVYGAALKALDNFIAHNPAAQLPSGRAQAKAG